LLLSEQLEGWDHDIQNPDKFLMKNNQFRWRRRYFLIFASQNFKKTFLDLLMTEFSRFIKI